MTARLARPRRVPLAFTVVAIASASALLLPIARRSIEVEARAKAVNADLARAVRDSRTAGEAPSRPARIEGPPREVFAWLRDLEASPPERLRLEVAVTRCAEGASPWLVAELFGPGEAEEIRP